MLQNIKFSQYFRLQQSSFLLYKKPFNQQSVKLSCYINIVTMVFWAFCRFTLFFQRIIASILNQP